MKPICIIAISAMTCIAAASDKSPAQKRLDFSVSWWRPKEKEQNITTVDLMLLVPFDNCISGTITYLDKANPPKEHTVTTLIGGGFMKEKLIPIWGKSEDEAGHEMDVWIGRVEFVPEGEVSKITKISCKLRYVLLPEIRDVKSFDDLSKKMRTWEGDAKEDNELRIRL